MNNQDFTILSSLDDKSILKFIANNLNKYLGESPIHLGELLLTDLCLELDANKIHQYGLEKGLNKILEKEKIILENKINLFEISQKLAEILIEEKINYLDNKGFFGDVISEDCIATFKDHFELN